MGAARPAKIPSLDGELLDKVRGGLNIPSPLPWEWGKLKPPLEPIPIPTQDPRPPKRPR